MLELVAKGLPSLRQVEPHCGMVVGEDVEYGAPVTEPAELSSCCLQKRFPQAATLLSWGDRQETDHGRPLGVSWRSGARSGGYDKSVNPGGAVRNQPGCWIGKLRSRTFHHARDRAPIAIRTRCHP